VNDRNDMGEGNVSVIITLIFNTNTTLCADCPDENIIEITPDLTTYKAGDELTCSSNGYPAPTYSWTAAMIPDSSTTNTVVILEGDNEYICTATVTVGDTPCTATETVTVIGYSEYQKQEYVLWNVVSVPSLQFLQLLRYWVASLFDLAFC